MIDCTIKIHRKISSQVKEKLQVGEKVFYKLKLYENWFKKIKDWVEQQALGGQKWLLRC